MKAVVVTDFDAVPTFEVRNVEEVPIAPGEVRVRVAAASLNLGDAIVIAGKYQVRPDVPFIAGAELAGTVVEAGEGVESLAPGDRVCACGFIGNSRTERRLIGSLCERVTAPAPLFSRIPNSMNFHEAVLFRNNYVTAYYALKNRARLARGETLLVLGASGGTGLAAVQLGKLMGARVIASASSDGRRTAAREAGADVIIGSRDDDWRAQLRAVTGAQGVDVVFDPVGGAASEPAFRSLAPGGRHLVVGFASGDVARIATNVALLKDAALVGVNTGRFQEDEPEAVAVNLAELFAHFEAGHIHLPRAREIYRLTEFADAFERVIEGRTDGRVIIEP